MIAFVLACVIGQQSSTTVPVELRTMLVNRDRTFSTAIIDWEWDPRTQNEPGKWVDRYTSQYAGSDYLCVEYPPDDPAEVEKRWGQPGAFCENRKLVKGHGDRWHHIPGSLTGSVRDDSSPDHYSLKDIRILGLAPQWLEPHGANELGAVQFFERRLAPDVSHWESTPVSADLHRVTAFLNNGSVVTWDLDPRRDFELVQCEGAVSVSETAVERTTVKLQYAEVDGKRFPSSIQFFRNGNPAGKAMVTHAEFDRPYHPQELSVGESLRMMPGTNIMRGSAAGWSSPRVFDGEKDVSVEEGLAMEKAGLIDTRPFLYRVVHWEEDPKGAYPKSSDDWGAQREVRRQPGLWEDYTRRFIRDHQLDGRQTDAAWKFLRECQKKAYDYLDKHEETFASIRKERVELRARLKDPSTDPKTITDGKNVLSELNEREDRIYDRIDAMFEESLKPGLYKLLTPSQLKAAQARAQKPSQPLQPR